MWCSLCMACTSCPQSCHKVQVENAHRFWWCHGLCTPSLLLSLQQDLSYIFLGRGSRHSWHSREKPARPIMVSTTSWQSWREDGEKNRRCDCNLCMHFGRENTVWLWAWILPLSGKSLKTLILQAVGKGKGCFWEVEEIGTCWWGKSSVVMLCRSGFNSRRLHHFCCCVALHALGHPALLLPFPLRRRGKL